MKRAFTLIELLVVIAIIAILAAILFPVFAQAKAAAKKTVSISNNKQIALAAIMYGGDSDDMIPVITNWGAPGVNNGAYVYFNNQGCLPWTQLVQQYVKNNDLVLDPQAPGLATNPAGFPAPIYKLLGTEYGVNPYIEQTGISFPYSATGSTLVPRSFTGFGRAAETIMYSQKYSNSETATNVFYGGWWFGPNTYLITLSTDPPDCYAAGNIYYCAAGWANNSFYGGTGGQKELKNVEAAGAFTGGASLRSTKNMVCSFLDGHAASKTPGQMADGTNYSNAMSNGIPIQVESAIKVTDITKEHWLGVQ